MKTTAFLVIAIAALGAVGITTAIMSSATPAHAQGVNNGNSPCTERGLRLEGCLPGQHVISLPPNDKRQGQGVVNHDHVGNPHSPQLSGSTFAIPPGSTVPKTGNPHGATLCNPQTGNPHVTKAFCD